MSISSVTSSQSHRYLLQLALSCRKITAQVTDIGAPAASSSSSRIVATVSSPKPAFPIQYHSKPKKRHHHWDYSTVIILGKELASQLREIGVGGVTIDLAEELSRPLSMRMAVSPLFESLRHAGVIVDGFERLEELGDVSRYGFPQYRRL